MFKIIIALFFSSLISLLAIAGMGGGGRSSGKQFNINLLAGVNEGNGNLDGAGGQAKFNGADGVHK